VRLREDDEACEVRPDQQVNARTMEGQRSILAGWHKRGKVVKLSSQSTESEKMLCANQRAISGQAQAPWGATRGVAGRLKVNGRSGLPNVVGGFFATEL